MNRTNGVLCLAGAAAVGLGAIGGLAASAQNRQPGPPPLPAAQPMVLVIPPGDYTMIAIVNRRGGVHGAAIHVGMRAMPIDIPDGQTLTLPFGAPTELRDTPRIAYQSRGGSLDAWGVCNGVMVPFTLKREGP